MYEDNDNLYLVSDMDEDIKKRKELIEEAKNINADKNWNEIYRQISDLRRKWRRISSWESAYEDSLNEEFESYIDALYAKRNEVYKNASGIKEELIAQAKKVAASNDLKHATEEMNELMNQWKQAGSAGKDDDALWESFNQIRQSFFDKKHEQWEQMQTKFSDAAAAKQDLIQQAKELANSEEWQKTSTKFKELMDAWKAAGSAGREKEDDLWNEFNEYRQTFYKARNAYYEKLHVLQDQNLEAKNELIARAKAINETKSYSRENTKQMKELGVEWKKIGSCRKEKEEAVWKNFKEQMDQYFDGLRQANEQKHLRWKQRMMEVRTRKDELMQEQKRQIKRMQEDIGNVLGERAISELEQRIEDKKKFIEELEAQIKDIDSQLSE